MCYQAHWELGLRFPCDRNIWASVPGLLVELRAQLSHSFRNENYFSIPSSPWDLISCPRKEEEQDPSSHWVCPLAIPARLWVPWVGSFPVHPGMRSFPAHPWMPRVHWEMLSGCGVFANDTKSKSDAVDSVLAQTPGCGQLRIILPSPIRRFIFLGQLWRYNICKHLMLKTEHSK